MKDTLTCSCGAALYPLPVDGLAIWSASVREAKGFAAPADDAVAPVHDLYYVRATLNPPDLCRRVGTHAPAEASTAGSSARPSVADEA